jgi:nucleoside-diphosphate-sugar epimerase
MRFLLTGATGFIGSNLCHRLIADGHEVLALVRSPQKVEILPKSGIDFLHGDLTIFRKNIDLPPVDVVIHLASRMAPPSDDWFKAQHSLQETEWLVECLTRQKWKPRRFLFASSIAAAGPTWESEPVTEDRPLSPVEAYGVSKMEVEKYLLSLKAFPTTAFRPPLVFGPEKRIANLFKLAQRGWGLRMRSYNQLQSFIFIDDLVEAIVAMSFESSSNGHQSYFTTFPQPFDLELLWHEIGQVIGKEIRIAKIPEYALRVTVQIAEFISKISNAAPSINMRLYLQLTKGHFIASSEKLHSRLGWIPKFNLENALIGSYDRLQKTALL